MLALTRKIMKMAANTAEVVVAVNTMLYNCSYHLKCVKMLHPLAISLENNTNPKKFMYNASEYIVYYLELY